jgi:hypothetical protein
MELQVGIETLLDTKLSSKEKIAGITDLLKDTELDAFGKIVKSFLNMAITDDKRVTQIANFVDDYRGKNDKQQQLDVTLRKLKIESSRDLGTRRYDVDAPYDRRAPDDTDECRRLCCFFPRFVRPYLVLGLQWIFLFGMGLYVLRTVWYGTGRLI